MSLGRSGFVPVVVTRPKPVSRVVVPCFARKHIEGCSDGFYRDSCQERGSTLLSRVYWVYKAIALARRLVHGVKANEMVGRAWTQFNLDKGGQVINHLIRCFDANMILKAEIWGPDMQTTISGSAHLTNKLHER
jgi:hypothetical protein